MFEEITASSVNNTNIVTYFLIFLFFILFYFLFYFILFFKIARHNYEIIGNELHYKLEINPNLKERLNDEISKEIVSSELLCKKETSITERMFYNLSYSN